MFNRKMFEARLILAEKNKKELAGILGMNVATLYRRLKDGNFGRGEMEVIKQALDFSDQDMIDIFFKMEDK